MANLASTYRNQGHWKEAEELDVRVMETTKKDPSRPLPLGGSPSFDPRTAIASTLNVTPEISQARENALFEQNLDRNDTRKVNSESFPQSSTPKLVVAKHSLWALAYENLQKANPELIQKFNYYLGTSTADVDDGKLCLSAIDEATHRALEEIQMAKNAKEKPNKMSAAMRKSFEQIIKIVSASNGFISSAVSTNPYAALAWTGVSLLLPLLLKPTEENEAAMMGLDYIANLLVVYRWQEKIYLHDDDAGSDFKDSAVQLYTAILEYEATLLIRVHRNSLERWGKDVFQAGTWSSRVISIRLHDERCRDVTNAIAYVRTVEWRDEERKWHDKLLQQPRQDQERRHMRMLYSNYEAGKNVNSERISGTCEWFLNHTSFLSWRELQSSSLLWLSADPGCGKSVLSKYLVDRRGEVLSVNMEAPVVCYFFFKDGDIDRMSAAKAICAFLHQLMMQRPHLYQYAKEDFENKNEKFLTDFDTLWNIFLKATRDPSSREIICVLDALDECQEQSRKAIIAKLVQLYRLRGSTDTGKPILKFLVTSRPDFTIVRDFKGLTSTLSEIRLRGEEESEQISREIDLVIRHKVEKLGSEMDLSKSDQSDLQRNLSNISHRTYLWLHLTFNDIEKKLELTKDEIAVIAKNMPQDVDEAYTAILDKSPNRERARRLLHIILAATRPLTMQEVNVALAIKEGQKSYQDLDIWPLDVCEVKIKNMCGLFLSVVDSKVYLIHQTAREFLVCEKYVNSTLTVQAFPLANWKKTFCSKQSNLLLAEISVWYLQLRNFEILGTTSEIKEDSRRYEDEYIFLSYAAQHWTTHFSKAKGLPEAALIEAIAYRILDTHSNSFKTWSCIYEHGLGYSIFPNGATNIWVASYFGYNIVVKLLLAREEVQANLKDNNGRTPLWQAAQRGHEAVVKLLLEREGVQADLKDNDGRTPLWQAVRRGHEAVVKLLLAREEVQADLKDNDGRTPLGEAARRGHEAVVKLLLAREEVRADLKDNDGRTPLWQAARRGHEAVVKLLLAREEVQADSKDNDGQTPLGEAARRGHEAVVKLLLAREEVQADSKDNDGQTPLWQAAWGGHEAVVKLLLEREEVQADSKDNEGRGRHSGRRRGKGTRR
ncbi:hypothetical protein MMC21_004231 [Puttea exsequens]|nr:hypothetical protein [Puttea exsequens]